MRTLNSFKAAVLAAAVFLIPVQGANAQQGGGMMQGKGPGMMEGQGAGQGMQQGQGPGPGMMGNGMMGPGMMGHGMMGQGYGYGFGPGAMSPMHMMAMRHHMMMMGHGMCPHMMGHGYGMGPGMMGPGMMGPGMMGSGMMGNTMMMPGYGMGQGMMMEPGMMHQGMGPGMGQGMGPGMMGGQADHEISEDDVREFLGRQLAMRGLSRLKVGTVDTSDDAVFKADIVTEEGSLAWRVVIDRRTGRRIALE